MKPSGALFWNADGQLVIRAGTIWSDALKEEALSMWLGKSAQSERHLSADTPDSEPLRADPAQREAAKPLSDNVSRHD